MNMSDVLKCFNRDKNWSLVSMQNFNFKNAHANQFLPHGQKIINFDLTYRNLRNEKTYFYQIPFTLLVGRIPFSSW